MDIIKSLYNGDLNKLIKQWPFKWPSESSNILCEIGHLDVLKFALERGAKLELWSVAIAAGCGHLHIVEYIHKLNRYEMTYFIPMYAASNGKIDVLKYCYEHNFPLNSSIVQYAAEYNQIESVKYCLEHNFPKTHLLIQAALKKGNYEILKMSYEYNCPISILNMHLFLIDLIEDLYKKFISEKKLNCLMYLIENTFPICKNGVNSLNIIDQMLDIVDLNDKRWILYLLYLDENQMLTGGLKSKLSIYKRTFMFTVKTTLKDIISNDVMKFVLEKYIN